MKTRVLLLLAGLAFALVLAESEVEVREEGFVQSEPSEPSEQPELYEGGEVEARFLGPVLGNLLGGGLLGG